MSGSEQSTTQKRQLLSGLLKLLLLVGGVALAIPFVISVMHFESSPVTGPNDYTDEVSLPTLAAGELYRFSWRGIELAIYRRTTQDLQQLSRHTADLRDSQSQHSDQPADLQTAWRSADKNYFVFFPYESRKHCLVQLNEERGTAVIFQEPCFGAQYDAAGRILAASGHPQQLNLAVPPHQLVGNKLRLGSWSPNMRK